MNRSTRNNQLDFLNDLNSDLDPGILFLLCLLAVCKTAPLYYCSVDSSAIMLMILVMSLIPWQWFYETECFLVE